MRFLKYIIGALVVASTSTVVAADWNASTRLEKPTAATAKISVITFTKENQTLHFKPSQIPFGLISLEKVVFRERNPLFLSSWANGSQTIMLRIFDPERKGSQPICEFDSVAQKSQLQIVSKKLQILIQQKIEGSPEWLDCATLLD